jgi:hypothetical protein
MAPRDGEWRCWAGNSESTYPADDVLMIRQVRLAGLAPIDLATIKIGVVRQTHSDGNVFYGSRMDDVSQL